MFRSNRSRRSRGALSWVALGCCLAIAAAACADPVHDAKVESLGGETAGIAKGPLHRAGQPCLLCHDGSETRSTMSVAGTVFRDPDNAFPVDGVEVLLTDAAKRSFATRTNCAGNFYAYESDYSPTFPVWVTVRRGDSVLAMESPMNKDGNCASCHKATKSPTSAGHVYVEESLTKAAAIPTGCAGASK